MRSVVNTQWWGWSRRSGVSRTIRVRRRRGGPRPDRRPGDRRGRDPAARLPAWRSWTTPRSSRPQQRQEAAAVIRERAVCWALGWATHEEIDRLNILQATLLAMAPGRGSPCRPAGPAPRGRPVLPGVRHPGDGRSSGAMPRCRRSWPHRSSPRPPGMPGWTSYARQEPAYLFDKHKGYPTAEHRRLVLTLGPSRDPAPHLPGDRPFQHADLPGLLPFDEGDG